MQRAMNCIDFLCHLLLLLCLARAQQQPEPKPEPESESWFGDFLGSLSDPQNIGIVGQVYIVNQTTFQIVNFSYNGQTPDLYFWADTEPVLTSSGVKIPSFEFGVRALGKYDNAERVVLVLPEHRKTTEFGIVGLWCLEYSKNFGSVKVDRSKPPPKAEFLVEPNKELRGSNYQVGSGPILILDRRTIKVFGFTFDGDKAPDGFFFVGNGAKPNHNGVKVPIRGRDTPDMITAMNQRYKGGRDLILDLPATNDVHHIDWLSVYCYKFRVDFGHVLLQNLSNRIPPYVPPQKRFDDVEIEHLTPWSVTKMLGTPPSRTVFTFHLGMPGGRKGYRAMAGARPNEFVWYVNGYMAPELFLKRGITYTFNIKGGDDKSTTKFFNPLYISDDPFGGYSKLSENERKQVKVFAGTVDLDEQLSKSKPDNVGELCRWLPTNNGGNADDYQQFVDYRQTLKLECTSKDGPVGSFVWTPNATTPDTLYYQSSTNYNMGWKVHIVNQLPTNVIESPDVLYRYQTTDSSQPEPEVAKSAPITSISSLIHFILVIIVYSIGHLC